MLQPFLSGEGVVKRGAGVAVRVFLGADLSSSLVLRGELLPPEICLICRGLSVIADNYCSLLLS